MSRFEAPSHRDVGAAELGDRVVAVLGEDPGVEGLGPRLADAGGARRRRAALVGQELVEQQAPQRLRASRVAGEEGPLDHLGQPGEREDRPDRVRHVGRHPLALAPVEVVGHLTPWEVGFLGPDRHPSPVLGGRLIAAAAVALAVSRRPPPPRPLALGAGDGRAADAASLGAEARPALPAASLARLERRAGRGLPELRRVYRVDASGAADARRIARRLDARRGSRRWLTRHPRRPRSAGRHPRGLAVLDPAAVTPDLEPFQDYRAGLGHPRFGARGAGMRVADVEYEWRRTHEELGDRGLPAPVVTPGGSATFKAEEHGTAVLGILGADDDGSGITGLVHASQIQPRLPVLRRRPPTSTTCCGRTLAAALDLRPGDVLLIEQQTQLARRRARSSPRSRRSRPMRDLIRAIVDTGVVVIEPAGNGDRDLASFNLPWLADPADPGNSGALLVGAGDSPTTGTDLARAAGTNYGSAGGRAGLRRRRPHGRIRGGHRDARAEGPRLHVVLRRHLERVGHGGRRRRGAPGPGARDAGCAAGAGGRARGPRRDRRAPARSPGDAHRPPPPGRPPPRPSSAPSRRRRPVRTRRPLRPPPPPPAAVPEGGGTGGAPRRARRERPPRPARGHPHHHACGASLPAPSSSPGAGGCGWCATAWC